MRSPQLVPGSFKAHFVDGFIMVVPWICWNLWTYEWLSTIVFGDRGVWDNYGCPLKMSIWQSSKVRMTFFPIVFGGNKNTFTYVNGTIPLNYNIRSILAWRSPHLTSFFHLKIRTCPKNAIPIAQIRKKKNVRSHLCTNEMDRIWVASTSSTSKLSRFLLSYGIRTTWRGLDTWPRKCQ